jgi:hypothetical protein
VGTSDAQSRAFLGKLLKDSHDDCPRIMQALREAESLRPADPRAWLARAATGAAPELPIERTEANPLGRPITRMVGGFG